MREGRSRNRLEVGVVEIPQATGEPGRATGANASHQSFALVGESQPDSAAIIARAHSLEQASALEPVDVARQCRRGDALLGCELGEREPRAALDEPEKRGLARRHPELLGLLAQLPREPQQHRAKLGGDLLVAKSNVANH